MKRINAIALFTISALAAATGLVAQEPAAKANIPFNFTVGDTSMPAGEYTITASPNTHIVRIQSADRQHADLALGYRSDPNPKVSPRLVFDRYGDFYFLRRIESRTTGSLNLEFSMGKAEKGVRTQEAKLQKGEQILVASR
jgi:hypothetical protein